MIVMNPPEAVEALFRVNDPVPELRAVTAYEGMFEVVIQVAQPRVSAPPKATVPEPDKGPLVLMIIEEFKRSEF